ncbi:hypothetical protein [Pseudovibrio exalbescens]|uniref:PPM-type phosphatase domain-containing protein n=1 Tax=Pseudovibrio exalbescens TaxID=197461 RepID=A0A1U7JJ63_9HYPH|nr:hypothetical protein [Pseudovibrio exalbescens]OKL44734.1 hypothetical protein A3843_06540 [Pseudovibrio exalbescens]
MKIKSSFITVAALLMTTTAFASDLSYSTPSEASISVGSIDYFIEGKKGPSEKGNQACEDGLFFNDHYLAVFDGATDKAGKKYDGRKGGRVARDIILSVFETLPPNTAPTEVLAKINEAYAEFYAQHPDIDYKNDKIYRPTSTLTYYDLDNDVLVSVGDSKARIDGEEYGEPSKLVDDLNGYLRAYVIEKLQLSDDQIRENDWGRYYIMPLLKRQFEFQNNPDAPEHFQFWAIDGFEVPEDKLLVYEFDEKPEVIELSSDGYRYPEAASIESYEADLAKLLKEDPLMKKISKSTKGIKGDNVSFDDRAVLIFNRK